MLSVEDALRVVEKALGPPRARRETVPLSEALGRVLAEDVAMDHDVPPFHRATMDGFAVRAKDTAAAPAVLPVAGRILAGVPAPRALRPGEAFAIMTGAALPAGADAVVAVEATEPATGSAGAETAVRIREAASEGQNISRRGEQVARGERVLSAGTVIHPGTVGVLAAAGRVRVVVAARPRVAIVATGDEVVPADRVPGPSQIRESNGYALAAQVARAGGAGSYAGPVKDERAALEAAVAAGLSADVLCLSGGVSLGDKDLVPSVLEACGVERLFHRWAVKPGGPLWMGRRGETLVFGLPGNPAATFVGFELLVVPALHSRLGLPFSPRATVRAVFDGTAKKPIPRRQFVPVRLVHQGTCARAVPVRWTGSGDPFGLAAADALAAVPEGAVIAAPGSVEVDVVPLGVPA